MVSADWVKLIFCWVGLVGEGMSWDMRRFLRFLAWSLMVGRWAVPVMMAVHWAVFLSGAKDRERS